jgi:hypothetical protein
MVNFRNLTAKFYKDLGLKTKRYGEKIIKQIVRQQNISVAKFKNVEDFKSYIEIFLEYDIDRIKLSNGDIQAFFRIVERQEKLYGDDLDNLKAILNRMPGKWLMKFTDSNGKKYTSTINSKWWGKIKIILTNNYWDITESTKPGSDNLQNVEASKIVKIEIEKINKPAKIFANKASGFFQYLNKSDIDLTRYQVVRESDDVEILKEQCLIHTLKLYGITKSKLKRISLAFEESGVYFPKSKLNKVAEIIDRKIILHSIKNKENVVHKQFFGEGEEIHIGAYKDHYFILEDTEFTEFAIKHYKKLKDIENYKTITKIENGKYYKRNKKTKKCNSLRLLYYLMESKYFEANHKKITELDIFQNHNIDPFDIPLDDIEVEQREFVNKRKKTVKQDIFYADLETDVTQGNHKCIMAAIIKRGDSDKTIRYFMKKDKKDKSSPVRRMLKHAVDFSENQPVIYFHNLKYDFSVMKNDIYILESCEKDGQVYEMTIWYNKKKIILKDSYKMAPIALRNFQTTFGLHEDLNKKEAIGYTYHTTENMYSSDWGEHTRTCKITDYLKHVKKEDHETFMLNVKLTEKIKKPNGDIEEVLLFNYNEEEQTFDHVSYYMYYLKYDVLVLRAGLESFDKTIKKITKDEDLSIYDYLTISSITDKYIKNNGAYDGVYEVGSNLRHFLSQAVTGGRVSYMKNRGIYDGNYKNDNLVLVEEQEHDDKLSKKQKIIRNKLDKLIKKNGLEDLYTESDRKSYVKNINDHFEKGEYVIKGFDNNDGKLTNKQKSIKRIINQTINDVDAVSLYPSAVKRMCEEIGVPTGPAKKIKHYTKQELDNNSKYYIVKIRITKINKEQQIPFIHKRTEGESLEYVNKVPKCGMLTIIDSVTLQDYIEFHKIEYEILDGVFWNEGVNRKMGLLIVNLFKERLKEKGLMAECGKKINKLDEVKDKETIDTLNKKLSGHNAMQQIIKLMLNSVYGKTITKKSKSKNVYMAVGKTNDYVYNHYNLVKKIDHISKKQNKIVVSNYDDGYNLSHVGVMVLSYSKRIMNEPMSLANDNDIPIYYQDTDSMHMNDGDVDKLTKLYKNKYDRDLLGKQLGQLHGDFSMKKAAKGAEIVSVKTIVLGKKCYLDKLKSKDSEGKTIYDYHIRLKGVTKEGIAHAAKQYGGIENVFNRLAKGETIKFILNPDGKALFEFNETGVKTKAKFPRTLSFSNIKKKTKDNINNMLKKRAKRRR